MKKIITGILLILITAFAYSQNVTNIEVKQVGANIEISYSLDKQADISISISLNEENTFRQISNVTGDIGKNISPGRKKMVWNVLAEYEKFTEDNVVFKVIASESSAEKAAKEIAEWKKAKKQEKKNSSERYAGVLGLDFTLGYPIGVGFVYSYAVSRVIFNVAKIQVLNFYDEDFFMQYMAGIEVRIARKFYVGARLGYWHFAPFSHGGFCIEPELRLHIRKGFYMALTYNYLANFNRSSYIGNVGSHLPGLKLGWHFRVKRR